MLLSFIPDRTIRNIEIITGLSIILLAVFAGFSFGMVFMKIFIKQDPSLTLDLIIQNEVQYKLSILGWMGILTLDLLISLGIYYVFKKAHSEIAILAGILRFAYSMFLAIALAFQVNVLTFLELHKAQLIDTEHLRFLVHSGLSSFESTWNFGLILFSFHLGLVAYLCFKSKGFKWLSYLVAIAALGYFIFPIVKLINPMNMLVWNQIENLYSIPMALGELSLAIWLLIKIKE